MLILSSWFIMFLSLTMSFLFFCLLDLSVFDAELLKFLIIIIDLCISSCSSIIFLLQVFWCSVVRTYTLKIVLSSWRKDPFTIINSPLCNNRPWSALSKINIAVPTLFWLVFSQYIFLHPFPFAMALLKSLYNKWLYYKVNE